MKSHKSSKTNKFYKMKKLVEKTVKVLFGGKVYANHTAIKGKKSSGVQDYSTHKHWKTASSVE